MVPVSSGHAPVSPRRAPTHGAARAGRAGFAEALRRQLGGVSTRVTKVLLPAVDTPATAAVATATLAIVWTGRPVVLSKQARFLPLPRTLAARTIGRIVAAA